MSLRRLVPGRALFLLWALGFLAIGCGEQRPLRAIGPNDEISVFTNSAAGSAVREDITRLLAYPVEVVGKEAAYMVEFIPFREFSVHRHVKNQMMAVDLSSDDALARAVPEMLTGVADAELAAREPFLKLVRNRWAQGQTSLFAVAWNEADLEKLLAGPDTTQIRRDLEDAVTQGLTQTMYSMGEDRGLARMTANRFGWTVRVLPEFFAAESPVGDAVKFNAKDPVRLILIHWRQGEIPLTPAAWEPVLAEALHKYNDGDSVLVARTQVFAHDFQRAPALKWEGVWQNEKYTIGGAFRAYACHREGTSYLLVGIVYAPGQDKVPPLRQVEGMLQTFRLVR